MSRFPETVFARRVLQELKEMSPRGTWFKIQQVSVCGTPDIIGCCNGWFVAIELKTDLGRTSKLQDHELMRIRETGGLSFVARPSTWHDVKEKIQIHCAKLKS